MSVEIRPFERCAQLYVDQKPYLLLAGEMHNSSAGGAEPLARCLHRCEELGLNALFAPVSWEVIEPKEGQFCFESVRMLVEGARKHGLKLILLWFGTWKNGLSTYAPAYIKDRRERFGRCRYQHGEESRTLSPFCTATLEADRRAFVALMQWLKDNDAREQTVLAVQVENEAGFYGGDRDWSRAGQEAFEALIPPVLSRRLEQGELGEALARAVFASQKTSGTWLEVFGAAGAEACMAWGVASYIEQIARAGKTVYPLPMIVNAWTVQYEDEPARLRPCGGPVHTMRAVWEAAAPSIDAIAPDCYLEDFAAECAPYALPGKLLLVPEMRPDRWAPAVSLYAIGELCAAAVSPFGIDGLPERAGRPIPETVQGVFDTMSAHDPSAMLASVYSLLRGASPQVLEAQSAGRIRGVLQSRSPVAGLKVSNIHLRLVFPRMSDLSAYPGAMLLLDAGGGELFLLGLECRVQFISADPQRPRADFHLIEQGRFESGEWLPERRLNGDEQNVTFGSAPGWTRVKLYCE